MIYNPKDLKNNFAKEEIHSNQGYTKYNHEPSELQNFKKLISKFMGQQEFS